MMAERNANHLRAHLSVFEAGYPIQKGYIAQLLIVDGRSVPDVVREVRSIVQTAEPGKILNAGSLATRLRKLKKMILDKKHHLTREWQSLIKLFLRPFTITFKSPPDGASPSETWLEPACLSPSETWLEPACLSPSETWLEPACLSPSETRLEPACLSPSETRLEPACPLPSETRLEPDIPQPGHRSPTPHPDTTGTFLSDALLEPDTLVIAHSSAMANLPSFTASCEVPSPKRLKGDCAKCVTKKRTNINMLQENRRLQRQIRELKVQLKRRPQFSMSGVDKTIKRKTQSANLWRTKYTDLKEKYDDAIASVKDLDSLKQTTNNLQAALNYCLDKNKLVVATNHILVKKLVKSNEKIKLLKKRHSDYKRSVYLHSQRNI